jgi:hypothetical protein
MNPLSGIASSLSSFFGPEVSNINSFFQNLFHQNTPTDIGYISKAKSNIGANNVGGGQQPQQTSQPQVLGTQNSVPSPQDFQNGFNNYSPNLPIASQSGLFSQAAQQLPGNIDKFLPAIISLMETSGGRNMAAPNNFFNLSGIQNGQQGLVSYPDLKTALVGGMNGGVQSQGFMGNLLNNPAYKPFLQSGNLADFFKIYTPPGVNNGNPTLPMLLNRYDTIRQNFRK